jgi:cell division protease FtsH
MKKFARSPGFFVLIALAALLVASQVMGRSPERTKIKPSDLRKEIQAGRVDSAKLFTRSNTITGELTNKEGKVVKYRSTYAPETEDEFVALLDEKDVTYDTDSEEDSIWLSLLFNFLPFLLMIGLFLWLINSTQGGGNRIMQFGKAKAKVMSKDQPKTTFADVAGCDEAIEELHEIKEFLENPAKFAAIGAKVPKGVLLYGPPGTGKTLLAKAVAGEAGVPFLSISGSDFVEMFVGVGASRVRDLFEQAKASAPSIIFVDEIDAVGRHRGAGLGGGHDEREQTLNQLLVEMDGFDARVGVIMIAGTNRPDILDPALLRPGRFDRQIMVDRPDLEGRKAIFRIHAKGKPLAADVELDVMARSTPGFTGADIANVLNEAALFAARRGKQVISQSEMEAAIDRVLAGPEKKSRIMNEHERKVTAYHEAGHALVGHVLPNCDPIHKVTIIPRGRALGLTLALPTEDRYSETRSGLRDRLAMLLGGRTAEELIFSEITTGASNDIERATSIARAMVTEYGMSDILGPQQLGEKNGEVFLGRDIGRQANYSDAIATKIDAEVRMFIDTAHSTALDILTTHRDVLEKFTQALLQKETLDKPDIDDLFKDLPKWSKSPDVHVTPTPAPIDPPRVTVDEPELAAVRRTALSRVRNKLGKAISGSDDDANSGGGHGDSNSGGRRPAIRPGTAPST